MPLVFKKTQGFLVSFLTEGCFIHVGLILTHGYARTPKPGVDKLKFDFTLQVFCENGKFFQCLLSSYLNNSSHIKMK